MKCAVDDEKLVVRKRVDAERRTIVFEYNHCDKCGRDYLDNGKEIIVKGLGYILKKDIPGQDCMI